MHGIRSVTAIAAECDGVSAVAALGRAKGSTTTARRCVATVRARCTAWCVATPGRGVPAIGIDEILAIGSPVLIVPTAGLSLHGSTQYEGITAGAPDSPGKAVLKDAFCRLDTKMARAAAIAADRHGIHGVARRYGGIAAGAAIAWLDRPKELHHAGSKQDVSAPLPGFSLENDIAAARATDVLVLVAPARSIRGLNPAGRPEQQFIRNDLEVDRPLDSARQMHADGPADHE